MAVRLSSPIHKASTILSMSDRNFENLNNLIECNAMYGF